MSSPISPEGLKKLRLEWEQLWRETRPKLLEEIAAAAAQGDRSENAEYIYGKKRLREIDKRLRDLDAKIQRSVVVEQTGRKRDKIYFGARVRLLREDGKGFEVQLVGNDEIDPQSGKISRESPLGMALFGHVPKGRVAVQTPKGLQAFTIEKVDYP
jgi:transcription elongation factor GreB